MKMTIDIPKEVEDEMLKKLKEEIKDDVTHNTVIEAIQDSNIPIDDLIRASNIYQGSEDLADKQVCYLTKTEKLTLALKWLFYDHLI